jgi:hypothetical protein
MSLRLTRPLSILFGALLFLAGAVPASAANISPAPAAHTFVHRAAVALPAAQVVTRPSNGSIQWDPRVVPLSQLKVPARDPKVPFFHGGVPSKRSTVPLAAPLAPRTYSQGSPTLYNNLNKAGMPADGVTPPDSTGAIGPNNYVEFDNSRVAVYDRSLNIVGSSTSLDSFVGAPGGTPLCDPQIQWVPSANRWLYSVLICNTSSSTQGVTFGWSKTTDPTDLAAGWCNAMGVDISPLLFDYQKLGHNANYFIIGGNLYDETNPTSNPPFLSAGILWAPLPAVGDTSCTLPAFVHGNTLPLRNGDGSLAFTPVPVNTTTNAADGYIVSAFDPAGNVGSVASKNKLAVWRLDAAGALHASIDQTVNTYAAPTAAAQHLSTNTIDTLDARLTQAVGDPATGFYTQHTVSSAGGVSEVDWYELTASGGVPSLVQQGAISRASTWVFNAAISPRFDGQGAAMFYTTSDGGSLPTIMTQIRRPTTAAGTFEAGPLTLATSTFPDGDFSCNAFTTFPCRWGDYSGATPDPVQTNVVWGTSEFNTAATGVAWSNENFAVYAAVRPNTALAVSARTNGRGDATINWMPDPFDPGAPVTSYKITAYVGVTPGPTITVTGGAALAALFKGLNSGTTYTFTVIVINAVGSSLESSHSGAIQIDGAITQSSPHAPTSRGPVNGSPPNPGPHPR